MANRGSGEPARVQLSLGSNLGDRAAQLDAALAALDTLPETRLVGCSSVYETEPVGVVDQPAFLNACAEIETALPPLELLNAIKVVEKALGRVPAEKWGPRAIDIDIVLWGDCVMDDEPLRIPHPAFRNRAFVLTPLADIAPDAMDPETGLTVAELAQRPEAQGAVKPYRPN